MYVYPRGRNFARARAHTHRTLASGRRTGGVSLARSSRPVLSRLARLVSLNPQDKREGQTGRFADPL